jgi:hypothetical protein
LKQSTQKLVLVGALVAGIVALLARSAGATLGGDPSMPSTFHPELRPIERAFVWDEVQNNTGDSMQARASVYVTTTLSDGTKLSPAALAALMGEALVKKTGFTP